MNISDLEKLQTEAAKIEETIRQRLEIAEANRSGELASIRLELLTAIVDELPPDKRHALLTHLLDLEAAERVEVVPGIMLGEPAWSYKVDGVFCAHEFHSGLLDFDYEQKDQPCTEHLLCLHAAIREKERRDAQS